MDKLIGIVGSSGLIGTEAVRYLLDRGYTVRGGQRRAESPFEAEKNFERRQLDLYSKRQLDDFCKDCDAVLNCAGPSYKIKDLIAQSASAAGAVYIDMSDILITESSLRKKLDNEGVYIVGTGYVPGISGILLNTVISEFDPVRKIQCLQAGRQYYTRTAFYDILLSSVSNAGYPDSCLIGNEPVRIKDISHDRLYVPSLAESVYTKPYIPAEIIDLSRQNNSVGEIYWYNGLTDKRMMDMIMQSYREVAFSDSYENAMKLYDELFSNMEKQENWSEFLVEAEGQKDGKYKRTRYILNISDSNIVCGITAAQTVVRALENSLSAGVYWAKDVVRYSSLAEFEASLKGCTLTVIDIPEGTSDLLAQEDESDYI